MELSVGGDSQGVHVAVKSKSSIQESDGTQCVRGASKPEQASIGVLSHAPAAACQRLGGCLREPAWAINQYQYQYQACKRGDGRSPDFLEETENKSTPPPFS